MGESQEPSLPHPQERPPPRGPCLGPLPPALYADLCPALGAKEGPASLRLAATWQGASSGQHLPNLLPPAGPRSAEKTQVPLTGSKLPPRRQRCPGQCVSAGNVSHPHSFFFFNLLQNLTKHWPQLVPTCFPQKLLPSPSQSLWVQPGIPSGKEAHLLTTPTLVRLPLQVPAAPSDQVEK